MTRIAPLEWLQFVPVGTLAFTEWFTSGALGAARLTLALIWGCVVFLPCNGKVLSALENKFRHLFSLPSVRGSFEVQDNGYGKKANNPDSTLVDLFPHCHHIRSMNRMTDSGKIETHCCLTIS